MKLIILFFCVVFYLFTFSQVDNEKFVSGLNVAQIENSIIKLINDYRVSKKLNSLIIDTSLSNACRSWSDSTIKSVKKVGHLEGEHSNCGMIENIAGWGVAASPFIPLNNNIFYINLPNDIFNGWVKSPGHNYAMLYPAKTIGVGASIIYFNNSVFVSVVMRTK